MTEERGATAAVAADSIAAAVNEVGEIVSGIVATTGHGASDVLRWLGDDRGVGAARLPAALVGPALWLGDVLGTSLDFVGADIKGACNVVSGVVAGSIRMGGGVAALDVRLVTKGAGDVGASIVGCALVLLGKAVEVIQSAFGITPRRLTDNETETLRLVFRDSVSLRNVRIVEGRTGIFDFNDRPFTLANTIYMKRRTELRTLVHECAHVWQNQHEGFRYTADALWAQITVRPLPYGAYDWEAELARGRTPWTNLNKEAQASFLDSIYEEATQVPALGHRGEFYGDDPIGGDVSFVRNGVDYTHLARSTVAHVRSRRDR